MGLKTDLDGLYLLLAGIGSAFANVACLTFVAHFPFPGLLWLLGNHQRITLATLHNLWYDFLVNIAGLLLFLPVVFLQENASALACQVVAPKRGQRETFRKVAVTMADYPYVGTNFDQAWQQSFVAGSCDPDDDHPAPMPLTVDSAWDRQVRDGKVIVYFGTAEFNAKVTSFKADFVRHDQLYRFEQFYLTNRAISVTT